MSEKKSLPLGVLSDPFRVHRPSLAPGPVGPGNQALQETLPAVEPREAAVSMPARDETSYLGALSVTRLMDDMGPGTGHPLAVPEFAPAVVDGLALLQEASVDLSELQPGSLEHAQAMTAGTTGLVAVLSTLPPEQQAQVLAYGGPAIEALTSDLASLSQEQQIVVFGNLSAATEFLGQEDAMKMADLILDAIPAGLGPSSPFGGVIQTAIADGNGATLSMALVDRMFEGGENAERAGDGFTYLDAAQFGMNQVREDYEESFEEVTFRTNELANLTAQWSYLPQEQIDDLIAGYKADHSEVFGEYEAQSAAFASILGGAAYGLDHISDEHNGVVDRDGFDDTLLLAGTLANSEAGQAAMAQVLLRAGQTDQRTWLDTAYERSGKYGEDEPDYRAQLDNAVASGANVAIQTTAASGDAQGALDVLAGMERHTDDPVLAAALAEVQAELEHTFQDYAAGLYGDPGAFLGTVNGAFGKAMKTAYPGSEDALSQSQLRNKNRLGQLGASLTLGASVIALADGVDVGEGFALGRDAVGLYGSFRSVDDLADFADGVTDLSSNLTRQSWSDLSTKGKVGMIGSGLGAAAGVADLFDGENNKREYLTTALSVTSFGADVAALLGASAGKAFLKRANIATTIVFSSLDLINALERGDYIGAAAAAAPLAGLAIGAYIGSVGGPIGAGVGAAIGALVGLGIELGRAIFADSPSEKYEKSTDGALEAMFLGMDMEPEVAAMMAHRFRNVGGDFIGAGPGLRHLAARMGVAPTDLLQDLSTLTDEELESVVNRIGEMDNNVDAIEEAQEEGSAVPSLRVNDPEAADGIAETLNKAGIRSNNHRLVPLPSHNGGEFRYFEPEVAEDTAHAG